MSEYKLVPVEPTDEMVRVVMLEVKRHYDLGLSLRGDIPCTELCKAMLSASPTTDTVTINRAEYEAMKELITLIKVARAWYWVAGDVEDKNRNHNLFPTKHNANRAPMWVAINKQIEAIDQARKV